MRSHGRFIRSERRRLGLRQIDLAYGICSVNTISRIENESQMPTAVLFTLLMERLGVSGFSYGDFFDGRSIRIAILKDRILQALDENNLDHLPEMLTELAFIARFTSPWDRQFLSYADSWYEFLITHDDSLFITKLYRALRDHDNPGKACMKADNIRGTLIIEIRILNTIAIMLHINDETSASVQIMATLIDCAKQNYPIQSGYWLNLCVLYNNLAVFMMRMNRQHEALKYLTLAHHSASKACDQLMRLRLFRTTFLMFPELLGEFKGEKMLEYYFFKYNNAYHRYDSFREFMEEGCLLNVI